MELDEIDPAQWALLEAATDDYIMREDGALDACAQLLVHNLAHARSRAPDISTLRLGAHARAFPTSLLLVFDKLPESLLCMLLCSHMP